MEAQFVPFISEASVIPVENSTEYYLIYYNINCIINKGLGLLGCNTV
jgi:hypothetical protein